MTERGLPREGSSPFLDRFLALFAAAAHGKSLIRNASIAPITFTFTEDFFSPFCFHAVPAAKCIKITGYAIPVNHKTRPRLNFEFRPKGTHGRDPNSKDRLYAPFAKKDSVGLVHHTRARTTNFLGPRSNRYRF